MIVGQKAQRVFAFKDFYIVDLDTDLYLSMLMVDVVFKVGELSEAVRTFGKLLLLPLTLA